jgi:hypothetical protein
VSTLTVDDRLTAIALVESVLKHSREDMYSLVEGHITTRPGTVENSAAGLIASLLDLAAVLALCYAMAIRKDEDDLDRIALRLLAIARRDAMAER